MSSVFLGNFGDTQNFTDGQSDIFVKNCRVRQLRPNWPVCSDNQNRLVSRKIQESDLSFVVPNAADFVSKTEEKEQVLVGDLKADNLLTSTYDLNAKISGFDTLNTARAAGSTWAESMRTRLTLNANNFPKADVFAVGNYLLKWQTPNNSLQIEGGGSNEPLLYMDGFPGVDRIVQIGARAEYTEDTYTRPLNDKWLTSKKYVDEEISTLSDRIGLLEGSAVMANDPELQSMDGNLFSPNFTTSTVDLNSDISAINTEIDTLTSDIGNINTEINGIDTHINSINGTLNSHNNRLVVVESRSTDNQTAIGVNTGKIATLETTTSDLGTRLTAEEGKTSNLQGRVGINETAISDLQSEQKDNDTRLDGLEADMVSKTVGGVQSVSGQITAGSLEGGYVNVTPEYRFKVANGALEISKDGTTQMTKLAGIGAVQTMTYTFDGDIPDQRFLSWPNTLGMFWWSALPFGPNLRQLCITPSGDANDTFYTSVVSESTAGKRVERSSFTDLLTTRTFMPNGAYSEGLNFISDFWRQEYCVTRVNSVTGQIHTWKMTLRRLSFGALTGRVFVESCYSRIV